MIFFDAHAFRSESFGFGILQVYINKIVERKIVNIFLPIHFNMFWVLKYPQHIVWLRNKKINFLVHTLTKGLYSKALKKLK